MSEITYQTDSGTQPSNTLLVSTPADGRVGFTAQSRLYNGTLLEECWAELGPVKVAELIAQLAEWLAGQAR